MLTKLLISAFVLTILCKSLSFADSKPNRILHQVWNPWNPKPSDWPNVKWNASQWPSATWRPPVSPNSPTLYPPLPNISHIWPRPPGQIQHTTPPSEESTLQEEEETTTTTTTTTTHKPISTEKRPTHPTQTHPSVPPTKPTVPPTKPTVPHTKPTHSTNPPTHQPPSQGEDPSKITVKSCGLSHIPHELNGNKIVSGKVAKSGEFPWQVVLKINTDKGNMQCGGAILNSKWVLTAAHCVSNERDGTPTAKRIDITAGVHNRLQMSAGSQARTADCVIQHESWRGQGGNFKYDIALLRLPSSKPFELTYDKGGHVNGICLPEAPMSEYSGKARIAGWGLTKDRGQPSDVLLYTDVSIITNDKCRQYQYPVPIVDSMICQGVDGKAPCQGDSGGALIVPLTDKRGTQRMVEIGVVSFGPGQCANAKTPNAIYTKVSHYLKWIEKTIAANGQKCVKPLRTDNRIGDDFNIENNSTISENFIF